MNQDEIMTRLQEIFRDVFEDDELEIGLMTSPKDIEAWDSLEHINLISAIGSEFHVKFSLNEMGKLQNVSNMLEVLKQKMSD